MQCIHRCVSEKIQLRITLKKHLDILNQIPTISGVEFIAKFVNIFESIYPSETDPSDKYKVMIKFLCYNANYHTVKRQLMKTATLVNPNDVSKNDWKNICTVFVKLFDEQNEKNEQIKHIEEVHKNERSHISCPVCDYEGCECVDKME